MTQTMAQTDCAMDTDTDTTAMADMNTNATQDAAAAHAANLREPGTPPRGDDTPLFLVGMTGAGKSTIGRLLARRLEREFVDLDHALEARCGVRVADIFEIEGEAGFRRREAQLLDECTQRRGIVLATGGGAVLSPESRQRLRSRGTVVYLRVALNELTRRLEHDRSRPLLQGVDPRARIHSMLQAREPLYAEVAHVTFDTGAIPAHRVARALLAELKRTHVL